MKKYLPIIITIILILIFGMSYLIIDYVSRNNASTIAEIYQDSKLIRVVDLSKEDTFTITTQDGSYNTIHINLDGEIAIIESSCPDKTCVHTGYTRTPSKPIICLPNKLEIRIVLEDNITNENQIDSFVY